MNRGGKESKAKLWDTYILTLGKMKAGKRKELHRRTRQTKKEQPINWENQASVVSCKPTEECFKVKCRFSNVKIICNHKIEQCRNV